MAKKQGTELRFVATIAKVEIATPKKANPYASELTGGGLKEDGDDVAAAQLLIAFTEAPRSVRSRGGRHVEYGIALALRKPVWLVGPRENVFHALADGLFASWPEAVRGLALISAAGLEPASAGRFGWVAEGAGT